MVIKRVGVMSVGKIYGVMCAAIGVLLGLVMAAAGTIGAGLASSSGSGLLRFPGFGIAAVVVLPIVYGLFGFIGGVISGALYNLFAGMVGGVEVETT